MSEPLGRGELFLNSLHRRVGNHRFAVWLRSARLLQVGERGLIVAAPTTELRNWLQETFGPDVAAIINGVANGGAPGNSKTVQWVVTPDRFRAGALQQKRLNVLTPKDALDTFVLGGGNQVAVRACDQIATSRIETFNPVCLHGRHGCGKTHLLTGFASKARESHPQKRVTLASGHAFAQDFTSSLRRRQINAFRNRYRESDVFVLDDVDCLESKKATQQELLYTVEALLQKRRQVVVASNRNPRGLERFSDKLKDLLVSGLVIQLRPPDYTTRLAILVERAARERVALPPKTLQMAARRLASDARQLLKGFQQLSVLARSGKQVDSLLGRLIIDSLKIPDDSTAPTPGNELEAVVERVAAHFDVELSLLKAKTRKRKVVRCRQIAMWMARRLTSETLQIIGAFFGNRTSSTVNHAVRRVNEWVGADPKLKAALEGIAADLGLESELG